MNKRYLNYATSQKVKWLKSKGKRKVQRIRSPLLYPAELQAHSSLSQSLSSILNDHQLVAYATGQGRPYREYSRNLSDRLSYSKSLNLHIGG